MILFPIVYCCSKGQCKFQVSYSGYQLSGEDTMELKLVFSKKATKIDEIFTVDLTLTTNCQIDCEDFVNFCGLLRKHELYKQCVIKYLTFIMATIWNKTKSKFDIGF